MFAQQWSPRSWRSVRTGGFDMHDLNAEVDIIVPQQQYITHHQSTSSSAGRACRGHVVACVVIVPRADPCVMISDARSW